MFVPGLPGFEPELLHQEANLFVYVQVLHDLIHIIVLVLLEPGVANLPEGGQLIRALNVLTVKIVERSDHTAVSLALLRLLQVVEVNLDLLQVEHKVLFVSSFVLFLLTQRKRISLARR